MEYTTLNNGLQMPLEGFGVFQVRDKEECKQSVLEAIKAGYRLIDTAASYTNEDAVGEAVKEAIREGICTREELFITSKMWVQDMKDYDSAKKAIDASLEKSGLEDAYKEGKLKAIGVSNFYPHTLVNFCSFVEIPPMVNQVELHPFFAQPHALEIMKEYHVQAEAWAPLGGGRYDAFNNEVLKEIASKHNKNIGQVMLRWNVQRGVVVIPKSVHVERIQENIDIWDFALSEEEMNQISSLDKGYVGTAVKHFDTDFVKMVASRRIHD